MTAQFAVERLDDAYKDALDLLRLHYDEVAPYKETLALDPDMATYRQLEDVGQLIVLTAREAGALVGYMLMFLRPHLHYRKTLVAIDDIHFVHPAHRKGSLGLRLIQYAEGEMARRGAKIMVLRTKSDPGLNHGLLFERIGYAPLDVVYSKRLNVER